ITHGASSFESSGTHSKERSSRAVARVTSANLPEIFLQIIRWPGGSILLCHACLALSQVSSFLFSRILGYTCPYRHTPAHQLYRRSAQNLPGKRLVTKIAVIHFGFLKPSLVGMRSLSG